MTSEVVVMNCAAVALAADSAATVSSGGGNKIFNSADKLFMLSKHHPVGVMVYSKSSLLGVPWETILKLFRRQLGTTAFPRLQDYSKALLTFLAEGRTLFPREVQDRCYQKLVEATFKRIVESIEDRIYQDLIEKDVDSTDRQKLARTIILEELSTWQTMSDATCYDPVLGEAMANRFSGQISKLMLQIFAEFPPDAEASIALRKLAMLLVSKEAIPREARSGLVIAGFGRDDHFPVMQHFHLGEIYQDCLKYRHVKDFSVAVAKPAYVEPFAHAEMIETFLTGINPLFQRRVLDEIRSLLANLPVDVVDEIDDLTDEQKNKWRAKVGPIGEEVAASLFKELGDYRVRQHLAPIYRAIAHLPKDQLAQVAASLVNLNSFQKRMSLKPETVGGPIDVAVISKGDGFIWIDRKHYFKPELNHHFFRNYYSTYSQSGDDYDADTAPKKDSDR